MPAIIHIYSGIPVFLPFPVVSSGVLCSGGVLVVCPDDYLPTITHAHTYAHTYARTRTGIFRW